MEKENNENMPEFLINAAKDSVSTYILELNYIHNQNKILIFSFLANDFCENLFTEINIFKSLKTKDDFITYAKKITKLIESNNELYSKINYVSNDEYNDYYYYSAIKSFIETKNNFQDFDINDEIYVNFISYLMTLITLQINLVE